MNSSKKFWQYQNVEESYLIQIDFQDKNGVEKNIV